MSDVLYFDLVDSFFCIHFGANNVFSDAEKSNTPQVIDFKGVLGQRRIKTGGTG
jgi:hypothetical protein